MDKPTLIFFKEINCAYCDAFLNNEWQKITSDDFLNSFLNFKVYVFADNPELNMPLHEKYSFVNMVPYFALTYNDITINLGACEKSRKPKNVSKHIIMSGLIPLFQHIKQNELAEKLYYVCKNRYK